MKVITWFSISSLIRMYYNPMYYVYMYLATIFCIVFEDNKKPNA